MFFVSCFSVNVQSSKNNYVETVWNILENAYHQGWNKNQIIKILGEPKEAQSHPEKKGQVSWFYFQKDTGFQEWTFGINDGNVIAVLYMPKDHYRSEFTIEKIMIRWKELNCQHKENQIVSTDLIRVVKYIGCSNNKIIAEYNRYNQVESIIVEK